MTMKTIISTMLIVMAAAGLAAAQDEEELAKVEVFGGYSLLRSDGENFHGWKAAVDFNLNRWLAIAVDSDGHYFFENTPTGKFKESEHSLTFGPHFSYRNKSKFVPFAYALAGPAWESHSHAGVGETNAGFAFETGGGFDWDVSRKVAIRVVDVSASFTRIAGHSNVKPKFSTGLVFKF